MTVILSLFVSHPSPKDATAQNPYRPQGSSSVRTGSFRGRLLILIAIIASAGLISCTPNLGAATTGWSPVATSEGVVYIGTTQGEIKALVDNGFEGVQVKWAFSGTGDSLQGVYNTPVVGENLIYVSAIDGFLYALDKESGTLAAGGWRQPQVQTEGMKPLVGGPALDETLGVVIVGSEDHNLYAYDSRTGQQLWQFATGGKVWSTPIIENGIAYFGSQDKNVYAVDLATGEEKWRFATGGAVVAQPLLWRGMVIIGSFDRKLYALDIEDGSELWSFESSNWYWARAVAGTNTIFAPSMDGNVYALDQGGNLLWQHQMGSPIVSSPVLMPRGLVVASVGGKISLLNSTGEDLVLGREISSLSIDPAEIKAPLFALPANGTDSSQSAIQDSPGDQRDSVYVGAEDGTVRRIQVSSGQNQVWCFDTAEDAVCN
jgi:outer membrane protein assembly factor BamB